MRTVLFWGFCVVLVGVARADDKSVAVKESLVNVNVTQVADPKTNTVEVQVKNLSKDTIIVDRQALQQPDFMASKDISEKDSGEIKSLHTGTMHGSVGGHWTLAQLQRREPERVITIPPGQTFVMKVDAATLLKGVDRSLQNGEIEVKFSFHDFLLAVAGQETSSDEFNRKVEADRIKIHWHDPLN